MSMSNVPTADEVIEAGNRWCRLVSASEWAELEALVTDDFTSRHANGKVESKSAWLENLRLHPRTLTMGEATVQQFGSIAVLSYPQKQNIPRPDAPPIIANTDVYQVWVRTEEKWSLAGHWHRIAWPDSRPLETHYRFAPGQII
jgi:Domain of unknown function (DUF4440)